MYPHNHWKPTSKSLTDENPPTQNQQKGNTMSNSLPTTRYHRTALVINTSEGVTSRFKERYERLLASVGGKNIKVDVFTQTSADVDVAAWAKARGFDMLVTVTNPKAEGPVASGPALVPGAPTGV